MEIDWTRVDAESFEQLCSELIRLALPSQSRACYRSRSIRSQADFQCDGDVERGGFEDLTSPVCFSFKTSNHWGEPVLASKSIAESFLRGLDRLIDKNSPVSVALWANHDLREAECRKIRKALGDRAVLSIEGRGQLESRLGQHPHLLTEYFGWSPFLSCVHSADQEAVLRELANDPLASLVAPATVPHPALDRVNFAAGQRLRVIGGRGAGKSFFVTQLLASEPDTQIIVLGSLRADEVWPHLTWVLNHSAHDVVIVIDNLHNHVDRAHTADALGMILDSNDPRFRSAGVIISHWSTERLKVEVAVPPHQWARWGFKDVILDDPPRDFLEAVVNLVCERNAIEVTDNARKRFVDEIAGWENTPACAAAALLPYRGKTLDMKHGFHPVDLGPRETLWRALFEDLENRGEREKVCILRTLSVLRWCGYHSPSVEMVRSLASYLGDMPPVVFDTHIEALEKMRWIALGDSTVRSHDVQVGAEVVGLFSGGRVCALVERYLALLSDLDDFRSTPHWSEILHHLGALYWQAGVPRKAAELNDLILASEPWNARALCNRGIAFGRCGEIDQAFADMKEAAKLAPTEIWITRALVEASWEYQRREEGLAALKRLEQAASGDPDALGFLTVRYMERHEHRRAILCGRRLKRLRPDDPSSHAALAQALWRSEDGRGQALTLLTNALDRWPDNGVLHGARALFLLEEQRFDEAMEPALEAVRRCPNDPRLYALLGWLHVQNGNHDAAIDLAAEGIGLFRSWPDLLAVKGISLAWKGQLIEARDTLLLAAEQASRLNFYLLPNVFLFLGRVALLLGNDQQADECFAEATRRGVDDLFVVGTRVAILEESGRVDEAVELQEMRAEALPESSREWWALARLKHALGDTAGQAEALRRLIQLEPNDSHLWALLGSLLLELDQPEEALAACSKSIDMAGSDPSPLSLRSLGDCLIRLSRFSEAAEAFDNSVRAGEDASETKLRLAFSLLQCGRPDDAIPWCRQAQAQEPDSAPAFILEAKCHLARKKPSMALRVARLARSKRFEDPHLLQDLVWIFAFTDSPQDVLDYWREARISGPPLPKLNSEDIYRWIQSAAETGQGQDLRDLLELHIAIHGPDGVAFLNLARCLRSQGHNDEAVERYSDVLKTAPLTMTVVMERAALLLAMGRDVSELTDPSSILYKGLDRWLATLYAAHAAVVAQDFDKAAQLFLGSARSLPDPPPTGAMEMWKLATAAEEIGIRSQVEQLTGIADDTVPDDPRAAYLSAFLTTNPRSLLRRLRAAHNASPESPMLTIDLSRAEQTFGNHKSAANLARVAAELEPRTTFVIAAAAEVLYRAGEPAEEQLALAEEAIRIAEPGDHGLHAALSAKAQSLNLLRRYSESVDAARASLAERAHWEAAGTLIEGLNALGRIDEAEAVVDDAMVRFPDEPLFQSWKAAMLSDAGRDEECIEFVRSMGTNARRFVTPILNMASCLERLGRSKEARAAFKEIREQLVRDEAGVTRDLADAVRGEIRLMLKAGESRVALELLLSLDEGLLVSLGLWEIAANLLCDAMEYGEVERLARVALTADPVSDRATLHLVRALHSQGRSEEALEDARRLCPPGAPTNPEFLDALASVFADQGQYQEAIECLDPDRRTRQQGGAGPGPVTVPSEQVYEWFDSCEVLPVVGLQLAAFHLGSLLSKRGHRREARRLLRRFGSWDWDRLILQADAGDRACALALGVLTRAAQNLGDPAPFLGESTPDAAPPGRESSTSGVRESLLESLLAARWPQPRTRAK